MTRKRFNVVTIAAMIAILALGSLGLGYAAWTDQIKLMDASVATGNMNVEWQSVQLTETDGYGVGECAFGAGSTSKSLNIDVTNAYPGYTCDATGNITNTGSVPVKVDGITGTDGSASGVITFTASCPGLATGASLAPGSSFTCTASVQVLPGAPEGTPYSSTATIDFVLP